MIPTSSADLIGTPRSQKVWVRFEPTSLLYISQIETLRIVSTW
jgi:hypothetical protein